MTFGSSDRHIPLLREVYEQFPEIPINIDIKVDNDELIRKVCCYLVFPCNWRILSTTCKQICVCRDPL